MWICEHEGHLVEPISSEWPAPHFERETVNSPTSHALRSHFELYDGLAVPGQNDFVGRHRNLQHARCDGSNPHSSNGVTSSISKFRVDFHVASAGDLRDPLGSEPDHVEARLPKARDSTLRERTSKCDGQKQSSTEGNCRTDSDRHADSDHHRARHGYMERRGSGIQLHGGYRYDATRG